MLPTPPEGFDSRDKAEDLLKHFLKGGKYDAANLPKRIKRADADEILKAEFTGKELKAPLLMRASQVMAFYDLRERAPQLRFLLTHTEKEAFEFLRSLLIVEILADFGDPKLQADADAYYKGLCAHVLAPKFWPQLIDLFVHLTPAADPQWIGAPLARRIKVLEPDIKNNDVAVEYYQLKDYQADRLATVLKAKKVREGIAANKDDHRRRLDLARFYLELEKFAYVDMVHWAVLELQRDCDINSPNVLAVEFAGVFDLVKAQAAKRGAMPDGDVADLKTYVTRCARAVDFYLGKLSKEQTAYYASHDHPDQADILSWDPFDSKTKRPETAPKTSG